MEAATILAAGPLAETPRRELDHRTGGGVEVRLLWDSQTNSVAVAVTDELSGAYFEFEVDPADALDAFHSPYVYAHAPAVTSLSRA